ncbi:MAG: hypothetical protein R3E90_00965 [Marinicella sp.]
MNADFADLLDQHMRRIRASAGAVATEIGMSREAVNNWRRGVSKPSKRHRDNVVACSSYLRLNEQECNAFLASLGFNDEFADFESSLPVDYSVMFRQLEQTRPYPIILVLSQAHIDQPPQKQVIIEMATAKYPQHQVLHVQLPFANKINPAQFFKYMGTHLNLQGVEDELSFEFALSDALQTTPITLLITRFEQGNPICRQMLAGILRNLCEMYVGRLQLILCGGEGLSALKYAQGELSLLNIAASHLLEFDLHTWLRGQSIDTLFIDEKSSADELLYTLVGHHPALASSLYQAINLNYTLAELNDSLAHNDMLYCDFNQVLKIADKQKLSQLLKSNDLGSFRPHLQDLTLRKLFWLNLIRKKNNRLVWQSEPIRQFGQNMLTE